MRLLIAVIFDSGLELQQISRINRNGPELWAVATKPQKGYLSVEPLHHRNWIDYKFIIRSRIRRMINMVTNIL